MYTSLYHCLTRRILPSALAITMVACGESPTEPAQGAAATTRDAANDVAERASAFGNEVGDHVADIATDTTEQVGDVVAQGNEAASDGARKLGAATTDGAQMAQEHAQRSGDTVASAADDVVEETRAAAQAASEWVSDLERPILAQRKEKCAQENGHWAETVDISPCEDGYATVTVDGVSARQECEGDGLGEQLSWQCVHSTAPVVGTYYFNDGPSTPHYLQRFGELVSERTHFLRWNELFWEAAVNHDYCYHHGQITYGYTQKDCDGQLIDDLLALCRSGRGETYPWFDVEVCMQNAQGMYGAVRQCGSDSFNAMNTRVYYPAYQPLFEKLDVPREDEDDARRERIESWTF